jgi:hypothetical protein
MPFALPAQGIFMRDDCKTWMRKTDPGAKQRDGLPMDCRRVRHVVLRKSDPGAKPRSFGVDDDAIAMRRRPH